jgi:hypothetical protein
MRAMENRRKTARNGNEVSDLFAFKWFLFCSVSLPPFPNRHYFKALCVVNTFDLLLMYLYLLCFRSHLRREAERFSVFI